MVDINEIGDKILSERSYENRNNKQFKDYIENKYFQGDEKDLDDLIDKIIEYVNKNRPSFSSEEKKKQIDTFLGKFIKNGKPMTYEVLEKNNANNIVVDKINVKKLEMETFKVFLNTLDDSEFATEKRKLFQFLDNVTEKKDVNIERLKTQNLNMRSVLNPSKIDDISLRENIYEYWGKIYQNEEKLFDEFKKLIKTKIFQEDIKNKNENAQKLKELLDNMELKDFTYVRKFENTKIDIKNKKSRAFEMFFSVLRQIDESFFTIKEILEKEGSQDMERESQEERAEFVQRKEASLDMEEMFDLEDFYSFSKIDLKTTLDPISYLYIMDDIEQAGILLGEKEYIKRFLDEKLEDLIDYFIEKEIPFGEKDIETIENFLDSIKEIETIDNDKLYLPIFILDSPIVKYRIDRFLEDKFTDIDEITKNILTILNLFRNYIEDENTIFNLSFSEVFLGVGGSQKHAKNIRLDREQPYAGISYSVNRGDNISPSFKRGELRKDLDSIKDNIADISKLVEIIYYNVFNKPYLYKMKLPFEGNGDVRIIMSYSENKSYASRFAQILRKRGNAFVSADQLSDIRDFMYAYLGSESRNSLINFIEKSKIFTKTMFEIAEINGMGKKEKQEFKEDLYSDVAALIGNIKDEIGDDNEQTKTFQSIDVIEEFNRKKKTGQKIDLESVGVLYSFLELADTLPTAFSEEKDFKKIKELQQLLGEMRKEDISSKLLDAHDSLRILKNEPLYYHYLDSLNVDDMESFLDIAKNDFNKNYTAFEVGLIVEEMDSFDNISKSFGVSREDVYIIKAHFR